MSINTLLIIFILYCLAGFSWQAMFFNLTGKQLYDILHERFPNSDEKNIKRAIIISKVLVATFWPYYFIKDIVSEIRRGDEDA